MKAMQPLKCHLEFRSLGHTPVLAKKQKDEERQSNLIVKRYMAVGQK